MATMPLVETIASGIKTTLETIVTTGGAYLISLADVTRVTRETLGQTMEHLACALLDDDPTPVTDGAVSCDTYDKDFVIIVWTLRGYDDTDHSLGKIMNIVFACLDKALMADPQRGTLALNAKISNVVFYFDPKENLLPHVQLTYTVTYRTAIGDPFTQR